MNNDKKDTLDTQETDIFFDTEDLGNDEELGLARMVLIVEEGGLTPSVYVKVNVSKNLPPGTYDIITKVMRRHRRWR